MHGQVLAAKPLACFGVGTKPYAQNQCRIRNVSHNSGVLPSSMCGTFRLTSRSRCQGKMSPRFLKITGAVAVAAWLSLGAPALAQSDDADAEMRIQRLENQLRQLTGQNEELQFRNRQLEERLRQLGDTQIAQPGQPAPAQPGVAAIPPAQAGPAYRAPQPQAGYGQP